MTSKFLFEISRENGVGLFTWVVVVVTEDTVVVVDVVVVFFVVDVELVSDGQVDGQKPYSPSRWVPTLKLGVISSDVSLCQWFIVHDLSCSADVASNIQHILFCDQHHNFKPCGGSRAPGRGFSNGGASVVDDPKVAEREDAGLAGTRTGGCCAGGHLSFLVSFQFSPFSYSVFKYLHNCTTKHFHCDHLQTSISSA